MSWFGGLLGQREVSASADILLERLQDSTKIDDRRKTISDLKSIVNENHQVIGKAIKVLINVLKTDRQDIDIIRDTIEILIAVMICSQGKDNTVELSNTEDFVKDANNVAIVLGLLEEKDYYIRYYTTQLVTILLSNKSDELQNAILQSPMGISRLMDLLLDPREIVRNEALLLLLELTKSNQEIQKIVAFEGAFERLLDIIRDEGAAEGGIIVQDCLRLVNNLLRNNVSNQNYFRETNCVKRLLPLLEVQNSDMWILTDNKFNILMLSLTLISLLVFGNNPSTYQNQTVLAQNGVINLVVRLALGKMSAVSIRSKALNTLGDLISGHGDNLNAFASISLLNETTKQTQPSLLKLVLVMLNAKDITERLASLHTLQCYLLGNEEGQVVLASTITPGGDEAAAAAAPVATGPDAVQAAAATPISIGGHLLRALLSWQNSAVSSPDPLPSWLAACAISCILKDNNASKELVLRIPLEIPKQGVPLVTLMTKTMRAFTQAERSNTDILIKGLAALLIGLCFQFNEDDASTEFNSVTLYAQLWQNTAKMKGGGAFDSVSADLISSNIIVYRAALHGIIMHRVGVDKYIEKLDTLRKSEDFNSAEQGKAFDPENPSIRFYDYDFTIFYKDAYDKIHRQLKRGPPPKKVVAKPPPQPIESSSAPANVSSPATSTPSQFIQHPSDQQQLSPNSHSHPHPHPPARHDVGQDAVIVSYKELIRSQDNQLDSIKKETEALRIAISQRDADLAAAQAELVTLRSAAANAQSAPVQSPLPPVIDPVHVQNMVALSQAATDQFLQAYNELEDLSNRKDDEINQLREQIAQLSVQPLTLPPAAPTLQLADEEDDFTSQINSQLQTQVATLSSNLATATENLAATTQQRDELLRQVSVLQSTTTSLNTQLQTQLTTLQQQNAQLHTQITLLQQQNVQLQAQVAEKGKQSPIGDGRDMKVAKLEMELRDSNAKYKALEKEQEELLQALANTELENNNLQERLRIFESQRS